ncbi:MAG TPA: FliM/FliN family flagellar motor C-terminal domain-containing protein [Terriglobales bacterium]|nr:FliM/FliN family flagellar motor C-terminal domain-containing protein [Terriglobales bacterium]
MEAAVQPAKEARPAQPPQKPEMDPAVLYGWLPCQLSLEVPVTRFSVGDLLRLKEGSIVETACHYASDVPLRANGLLIGWTEFEVIGVRLAVRITEFA